VTGLTAATTYLVQIAAINEYGQGAMSQLTIVTAKNAECKITEYSLSTGACMPCVEGGVCDKTSTVYAKPGYWQSLINVGKPSHIHKCVQLDNCKGTSILNANASCAIGHGGAVCATCIKGWTMSHGKCIDCNGRSGNLGTVLTLGVSVMLCVLLVCYCYYQGGDANKEGETQMDATQMRDIASDAESAQSLAAEGADSTIGRIDEASVELSQATVLSEEVMDNAAATVPMNLPEGIPSLSTDSFEKFAGLAKVVIGFMQIVSTLATNFPAVPWPDGLTSIWDFLSFLSNVDIFGALSMDCISSSFTFYDTFLINIIYPPLVIFVLVIVTRIRIAYSIPAKANAIELSGWKMALLFSFVIYPSVSSTVLKVKCHSLVFFLIFFY